MEPQTVECTELYPYNLNLTGLRGLACSPDIKKMPDLWRQWSLYTFPCTQQMGSWPVEEMGWRTVEHRQQSFQSTAICHTSWHSRLGNAFGRLQHRSYVNNCTDCETYTIPRQPTGNHNIHIITIYAVCWHGRMNNIYRTMSHKCKIVS